ncbi:hypothetical protein KCU92_g8972, partial [Aureobasidium melanogenum]
MGHHHSKPRQNQRTTLSSLQNDPTDLPPTYAEVFDNTALTRDRSSATPNSQSNEVVRLVQELRSRDTTIRDLEDKPSSKRTDYSDKTASRPKTTDTGFEPKHDELLLTVRDRERELRQAINQVRSGKRYTESVMASLEQEVRVLKQDLRQKTKNITSLEEQLEETQKLVEDRDSRINLLQGKSNTGFVKDCQNCKDLVQQLQASESKTTGEKEDLTTEVYALGCLVDFDNRYIETLYQRLRTCRIASMLVPPHLDTEEKKVVFLKEACECLSRTFSAQGLHNELNLSQEQQGITHLSTAAASEHRRQLVGLHIQEVYTELRLARDELKCRTDEAAFTNDDNHTAIEQEFHGIVGLLIDCHKLVDSYKLRRQHNQAQTDKPSEAMGSSSDVDEASDGC